jgi:hypothetical protein
MMLTISYVELRTDIFRNGLKMRLTDEVGFRRERAYQVTGLVSSRNFVYGRTNALHQHIIA